MHSLPVVDDDGRLVGIMTQSDMIATLYEKNLGKPVGVAAAALPDTALRVGPG